MSTKIHNGLRIRSVNLNDWIKFFNDTCFSIAVHGTKELMSLVKPDSVSELIREIVKYQDKKASDSEYDFLDTYARCVFVFETYIESSSIGRRALNCDCWFNGFPSGDDIYVIFEYPSFPHDKIEYPDWVEWYPYWDNTDPPKDISDKQWERRRGDWDIVINSEKFHLNKLTHSVIEANDWRDGGLYILGNMIIESRDSDVFCNPSHYAWSKFQERSRNDD